MIDVLVPVLGRPGNVGPLVESYCAAGGDPASLLFLCSRGDEAEIEACERTEARTEVVPWTAGKHDYARKMNHGYRITEGEFLFLGADDIQFRRGWDVFALQAMEGYCVVATNDLANGQVQRGMFGTHCLVRRSYVAEQGASADGPGVLMHEGYDHNFVDRELCHLAQFRGVYAFARTSIVRHRHPLFRSARMDSTYEKGLKNFDSDRRLFYARSPKWNRIGLTPAERVPARPRRSRVR